MQANGIRTSQVTHGYTNRGEVLGAGIGPGGNLLSANVSWVKGLKQIGCADWNVMSIMEILRINIALVPG